MISEISLGGSLAWKIGKYLIPLLIALLVGFGSGHRWASSEFTEYKLEQAEDYISRIDQARETELALKKSADELRKRKDEEIAIANRRLDDALTGLRNRPSRVDRLPSDPPITTGATGAELSREDGTFLAREAARADRLQSALKECYSRYEEIRLQSQPK
jgi:hypothetical protein